MAPGALVIRVVLKNREIPVRKSRVVTSCLLSIGLMTLGGCASGGNESASLGGEPPGSATFDRIDSAMVSAYDAHGTPMGITIYDRNGTKRHEKMFGGFSADERVAIASASKMVSGLVMFRLVSQGFLSLDSTTTEVLGWNGSNSAITLRQLLSFTSGLDRSAICTSNATITLAECVSIIEAAPATAPPATLFDYGSTHLHVAARMAEVVTGRNWNAIFAQQLRDPLRLSTDIQYFTAPRQSLGTSNPLVAGGLRMSMNEYANVLRLVFDMGMWDGTVLIPASMFDIQSRQPYPSVDIGNSPVAVAGLDFKYGLTAWLECSSPATGCTSISSPGAFGFTPWIDRGAGYFAILGMQAEPTGEVVSWVLSLEQRLKPLIAEAIAQ